MPSFDLVSFVSQINLIGVIFIVITLGLVIYELRLYLQERSHSHIHIPTFSQNNVPPPQSAPVLSKTATPLAVESPQSSHRKLIVVGAITILCFLLTLVAFLIFKPSKQAATQTTAPVTTIATKPPQVLLYTNEWKLIEGSTISSLNPGDLIYLAIEPPDKTTYDLARFRVNESVWSPEHETTKFNPTLNVYYMEYELPSDESDLKIDAQLHSKTSSWPVELQ